MSLAVLERERTVAGSGFNRWLIPPAALAVHLCIGQVYATSVYKASMVKHFGASLTSIGIVFSLAIVMLGLSAAVFGTWVDTGGPRRAMVAAALCWSTGFAVGAAGIATSQLWLLYLGYGVIGGIGLGIGYISPVSTLIKWFPDRPGLATGLAIMGFGGGAMIASPLEAKLLSTFDSGFDSPTALANGSALTGMFLVLGALYLVVMLAGAALVRVPPAGWTPDGWEPPAEDKDDASSANVNVSANNAIRTASFWLVWVVLFCNVTAGIGILEQAAGMIADFFRDSSGDSPIDAAAAAGFVGILSLFNMAGRFVWSSSSDRIGRKPIYMLYLGAGLALYLALAFVGSSSVLVFVLIAGIIISFYGGGFATVPAYLRDLFGPYQVGAIHGRLLTAWAAAGVAGPLIVNSILDSQGQVGKLTPDAYRPALLTMAAVLAVGFVANLLVRPVAEKFHEKDVVTSSDDTESTESTEGAASGSKLGPVLPVAWSLAALALGYGVYETIVKAVALF